MEQILTINYSTFETWKYRKRDIPNDLYLNDLVTFERSLPRLQRIGEFCEIAMNYHHALMGYGLEYYRHYLKRRKIEDVNDFFSYFYLFLTKYNGSSKEEMVNHRIEQKRLDNKMKHPNRQALVREKTTIAIRRMIFKVMHEFDTTDASLIMRKFFDEIEKKNTFTGCVSGFCRTHHIKSIGEFLAIIEFIGENYDEFIAETDL